MQRYFVIVQARTADDMRRLHRHGLDLFAQTAKQAKGRGLSHPFSIDGLLNVGEIEALVKDGYRVTIEDTEQARSHTGQAAGFDAWLQDMEPALQSDRALRRK